MLAAEDLQSICDQIAEGKSLRAICRERELAESSVRRWIADDEGAMAHSLRARELGCDSLADECMEIADNKEIDPAHKRIMVETRIRLIGKWSQRYSDKLTVNTNKTVTHKYDLDNLGTDQLEQLEGILALAERREGGVGEAEPAALH